MLLIQVLKTFLQECEVVFLGSDVAFLLLYDTVEMGRKDSWMDGIFLK